jgi:hypothetical protein
MMEDNLIRKLMASMKCESCGQSYEAGNIDILGHREDMWFMRVLCAACNTQCLVAAVIKEERASKAMTDLTERERAGFDEEVEADDVIDMHTFLLDFDGDFSRLFGQPKS